MKVTVTEINRLNGSIWYRCHSKFIDKKLSVDDNEVLVCSEYSLDLKLITQYAGNIRLIKYFTRFGIKEPNVILPTVIKKHLKEHLEQLKIYLNKK